MQRIEPLGGAIYYQFETWANEPAVQHGIFTRLGGHSQAPFATLNVGSTVGDDPRHVRANLHQIYETLGVDGKRACTVWQVHSAMCIVAERPHPTQDYLAQADGMITNRRGVPLIMRFADCAPILLYDPVQRAIGIAHAGWRGTVRGIAQSLVRAMQATYGTRPADLQAAIGPSISAACYQVGEDVVQAVAQAFGTTHRLIYRAEDGSTYFDLWEANRLALERAGVRHIEISGICTATRTDEFYSHRAENGKTGRFAAVFMLRE
ncbi:MAG: peptidoglycan editing factor PgeF [Candidatus Thermofonsia Clade 1 bacterium]|uniref:Purine nucleoside phosphorylase n=2 Tax=Candidatus Thermofonsia Clade 1 bacterium TaxID=2364210 RepID=A0A2M8PXH3_9CHLR|nr:MAG: peptidoglycan editing factor PgeF [Candidatus Thermofonsia Clade 1 bacterium]